MKKRLIILGAGGHGKVVADIARKAGKWENIAFLDDNSTVKESVGFEVIGKIDDATKHIADSDFFIALGNNALRGKLQNDLISKGAFITTLIHPSAVIGEDVEIGEGTVVVAGVVINFSVRVGRGCIINTNSSVDHDSIIGDFVHISPGVNIAGNVNVGKRCWVGIGSAVIHDVNLCDDCIIGAGAVVIKDIVEPGTYVGVPAGRI